MELIMDFIGKWSISDKRDQEKTSIAKVNILVGLLFDFVDNKIMLSMIRLRFDWLFKRKCGWNGAGFIPILNLQAFIKHTSPENSLIADQTAALLMIYSSVSFLLPLILTHCF